MADKTGIEWTEATWNPFVGCTHVSAHFTVDNELGGLLPPRYEVADVD